MKEQQERKAGEAVTGGRAGWTQPQVSRLTAGAAEGSPVFSTDLAIPS